jgi:hypothetical protein
MHQEWAIYFKDLIEGRPVAPWHVWWRAHELEIETALGRMVYLKLKFQKVRYAAELLAEHGVPFEWSARGRQAVIYSKFADSALDDVTGRLRPGYREQDGDFIEAFSKGNATRGHDLIRKRLAKIQRVKDAVRRCEELGDLESDGEALIEEGYTEAAVALLTAIGGWEPSSDLENAPRDFARKKLVALGILS